MQSLMKEVETLKHGKPRENNTSVEDKNRQYLQSLSLEKVSVGAC